MDERRILDGRRMKLDMPVGQKFSSPNPSSFDDSWFQKRLDFVRRELSKSLRTKAAHLTKEK